MTGSAPTGSVAFTADGTTLSACGAVALSGTGKLGRPLVVAINTWAGHAPGVVAAGALEPGRDFGAWVDRQLLGGHLWSQSRTWDPEGLVSTLPALDRYREGAPA